jgi:phosphoenolpyruvate carboxylase
MPYRVFLGQIAERLRATYDGRQNQYENAAELLADVELIAASLEQNRGRHAGLFAVRRFMRRIRSFGFHLATLDIRQSALVHRAIVGHALAAEDWLRASAADRRQRLAAAHERDQGPTQTLDAARKRTLRHHDSISQGRQPYAERADGP